jgi:hypothetical protein
MTHQIRRHADVVDMSSCTLPCVHDHAKARQRNGTRFPHGSDTGSRERVYNAHYPQRCDVVHTWRALQRIVMGRLGPPVPCPRSQ